MVASLLFFLKIPDQNLFFLCSKHFFFLIKRKEWEHFESRSWYVAIDFDLIPRLLLSSLTNCYKWQVFFFIFGCYFNSYLVTAWFLGSSLKFTSERWNDECFFLRPLFIEAWNTWSRTGTTLKRHKWLLLGCWLDCL